jgi:GNAT superfamily N-acetyltransferase
MRLIHEPSGADSIGISTVLGQWNESDATEMYTKRIISVSAENREHNQHYWVVCENGMVIGVCGYSNPLPKLVPLAQSSTPAEVRLLFVHKNFLRMGIGTSMIQLLERETLNSSYTELMARSSAKFKDTGWRFYEKSGYSNYGEVTGGDETKIMRVFGKILL